LPNGKLCGIAREWHTTGHHGIKTGKHDGPALPLGPLSIVNNHIKELLKMVQFLTFCCFSKSFVLLSILTLFFSFEQSLAQRVEKSMLLLQKGLHLKSLEERRLLLKSWIPFCMVCLRPFAKGRPVVLMRCNHVICEPCSDQPQIFCPIHEERFTHISMSLLRFNNSMFSSFS
jgi:hypothetical protein